MSELKWQKKNSLGIKDNLLDPIMNGLLESVKYEKEQLQKKLKKLKMLGLIGIDKNHKFTMEEIDRKIQELEKQK